MLPGFQSTACKPKNGGRRQLAYLTVNGPFFVDNPSIKEFLAANWIQVEVPKACQKQRRTRQSNGIFK